MRKFVAAITVLGGFFLGGTAIASATPCAGGYSLVEPDGSDMDVFIDWGRNGPFPEEAEWSNVRNARAPLRFGVYFRPTSEGVGLPVGLSAMIASGIVTGEDATAANVVLTVDDHIIWTAPYSRYTAISQGTTYSTIKISKREDNDNQSNSDALDYFIRGKKAEISIVSSAGKIFSHAAASIPSEARLSQLYRDAYEKAVASTSSGACVPPPIAIRSKP